jgi:hypothetical protein
LRNQLRPVDLRSRPFFFPAAETSAATDSGKTAPKSAKSAQRTQLRSRTMPGRMPTEREAKNLGSSDPSYDDQTGFASRAHLPGRAGE